MKINLNALKNKKITYPVLFVLLIIWISFLSSKTNFSKPKNTNTSPIIDNPASTASSKITDIPQILPNSNITPFGDMTISIQNKQITVTQNSVSKNSNLFKPVINFDLDNNFIIATAGQMYSTNVSYFLINPSSLKTTEIKSDKISPITSLSVSSDGKSAAVLGNYNSSKNTSNLYLQNLETNQNSLLLSNTSFNTIKFINDKQILIGYYSDSNEPNLTFYIFDLATNKTLETNYKSSPKTTCSNTRLLAYYDFSSKSIKILDLNNLLTKEIKYSFPDTSTWLLCSNSNIYAISPSTNKVFTKKINLTTNEAQTINTELNQNIFIQPFVNNEKLTIKTFDSINKTYQLSTID